MSAKTFLIMAGGTGGHVYPALATARMLCEQGDSVAWLGSQHGMEEGIIKAEGLPFYALSISGLRGKGLMTLLLAPFKLVLALMQAFRVIWQVKPDCVLGMGGFAAGPGGVAAKLLAKPLIIHEQNAVAGLTNRWLSKIANKVLGAFPHAFPAASEMTLTGNPLRTEICDLYFRPQKELSAQRKVNLLVLGGSLGAAKLNTCVPKAIALLARDIQPDIRHQSGKQKYDDCRSAYASESVEAKVVSFIDDMGAAYQWADFVICRAGALTISELCVAGLGAILVPYPHAVDDHQTRNAQMMEQGGAAWLLADDKLSPETLAEMLLPLLEKRERLTLLAKAARKLAKPEATELVAAECRSLCHA